MPDPDRKLYLRLTGTRIVKLRPRRGGEAKPTSFPTYEVTVGTATTRRVIGTVSRELVTRKRRTPGRRYADARWTSPGWVAHPSNSIRNADRDSRHDAIVNLLDRVVGLDATTAEALAATVRHDRG